MPRRLSLVLAVCLLAAAAAPAAHAAALNGKTKPAVKTPLPTNLRGGQAPEPGASGKRTPLAERATPATARPNASPTASVQRTPFGLQAANAPVDPAQCRMTCAHSYYFCPSSPGDSDCAATWSQCLADCSHPP
jgi:hypothetical protein